MLKLGQAVAGMIPVLGASPVAAAVGAVVAVAIAGTMPFMGHVSSGGARGRSSSSIFGQHLLSIVGGPLLGKAYTAARMFGRTPMAEELIKAMKEEMKRKQRYSTYMALHMEKAMLRPNADIGKQTLAEIKARNPESKLYGGEQEGFYQAQQYYLVWLYGSKATERLSQEELGHNSYLIYQLHSLQKKGQDLSKLTVEEMDRLAFENASRWFKIDSAVVTAYGAGTAYMEGRALSSTGKATVNPEGTGDSAKIPRTGPEWDEYFRSKYGDGNVDWKTNSEYKLYGEKYIPYTPKIRPNAVVTKPSLPNGGKPEGNYADTTGKDSRGLERQNEAADVLAEKGYHTTMLDEFDNGNGYGRDPKKSPDFIIQGQVFDCYSPESTNLSNINKMLRDKTTGQARRIVLNLNDYPVGNRRELIEFIRSQTHKDLKHLDELLIIEDRQVTRAYWRYE
ncbi:CdiA C-terminal domain-containing protein [Paenibacillus massiliensis]|uniref:CdiA C-terminal domain-containing protein n=1 Tax=Paenibacillus massiliensis TaxID=225917 RepID=UPI0012EC55B6|nr:hypothetical protein [Paenibacillus massiliensis]